MTSNVKNINSAAEIRASDAAVIASFDNLIKCAKEVIEEHGDIRLSYSELIAMYKKIRSHHINKSKGE